MNRLLKIYRKHGAQHYNPLPVILRKGSGVYLQDIEGKSYIDFVSSYSSVNQGHCHPRLVQTMYDQSSQLTLCSSAFHNENLIHFFQYMHDTFGYDKCLPMNTGVEGGETAIKLARLWGYKHKKIPENQATIVMANNNFWGRTITACSSSTNPMCSTSFGPYTPGFEYVDYNDINQLKEAFDRNPNIAAYMVEPIQGEAGILVPDDTYLQDVRDLCTQHDVLLICDEVQTGIGRTGKMLASDLWDVRPDIVILGKALSGGMMPISAVLCDDHIMEWMEPGMHGSTFGGNPLASKIAVEAIEIVKDEQLMENAEYMGEIFREFMETYEGQKIKEVRGKGLLNAVELYTKEDAERFVVLCQEKGLLCKITHGTSVRMCPPLVITPTQMKDSLEIIDEVLQTIDTMM